MSGQAQEKAYRGYLIPRGEMDKSLALPLHHFAFYEDKSGKMSLQDLMETKDRMLPMSNTLFQPHRYYWAKLQIKNTNPISDEWVFYLGYISNAEAYLLENGKVIDRKKAGFFVSKNESDPDQGQDVKIYLRLQKGKEYMLYIRFTNQIPYPPTFEPLLQSYAQWDRNNSLTNLFQGFFQGLLWMLLFYNLFLFLSLRDYTYVNFVLFVFFVSLYFLNEFEYIEVFILRDQPLISFYISNAIYISLIFFVQFNRRFLETYRYARKWDLILLVWLVITVLFALGCTPLALLDFQLYVEIRNYFHLFFTISLLLFILIVYFVSKDPVSHFFVTGNLFILAGAVMIVLGNLEIIPFNLYYLLAGIVVELFIFSMALSYRFRKSQEDKQHLQEQLIRQFEANRDLQEKTRQELEMKVRERTSEIEQQKEKILAQNEALNKKSLEIEHVYNKTTESIRYAQRLQKSILGNENKVKRYFSDSFVLSLPRDMVSGDFYWSSQMHNKIVLIVSDCTGHGIPAALMTILGNTILNKIINEYEITRPNEILKELDEQIVEILQNEELGSKHSDGMELVCLTFDLEKKVLYYAGAKNPLYYVRDFAIHQVNASDSPIGYSFYQQNKQFEVKEIKLLEGDIFYLSTDGFEDQFGGEKGSKYLKSRFREFLLKISHLSMEEQRIQIFEEFENWKNNQKQTDDVLIVGIKI